MRLIEFICEASPSSAKDFPTRLPTCFAVFFLHYQRFHSNQRFQWFNKPLRPRRRQGPPPPLPNRPYHPPPSPRTRPDRFLPHRGWSLNLAYFNHL